MISLAFDTSTDYLLVALSENGEFFSQVFRYLPRAHQENLLLTVDDLLRKHSLGISRIDLIVVGLGPGSYTGMRIGVSIAKGISLSLGLPVVGISTLKAISEVFLGKREYIVPVLDAKRGEVYFAIYEGKNGDELFPPSAGNAGNLRKILQGLDNYLLCGEAKKFFPGEKSVWEEILPWGKALISLGEKKFLKRGGTSLPNLKPFYLRPSYAEEALSKKKTST
jgi:tRNA threonylcarbamoyl adenosine modification protein YeaZ